jgi:hypothetical protein
MEKAKLDQLRALLPHRYAKPLESLIGDPEITDTVIQRVFSGDVTDYAIVKKVVDKAVTWAKEIKATSEKIDAVTNPMN